MTSDAIVEVVIIEASSLRSVRGAVLVVDVDGLIGLGSREGWMCSGPGWELGGRAQKRRGEMVRWNDGKMKR